MPAKAEPSSVYQLKITLLEIDPIDLAAHPRAKHATGLLPPRRNPGGDGLDRLAFAPIRKRTENNWGGTETDEDGEFELIDEGKVPVGKVLKAEADSLTVYDLGDNWRHDVVQEKILPADNSGTKPICLAGERRCPPEDVGGPSGYQEFLEVIFEPGHEQFERYGECGERILIGCAGPENTSGFQNLDLN